MKAETRAGYVGRIGRALKKVQGLVEMADLQMDIDKYMILFQEGKEVQDYVLDGDDTIRVSNRLQSYEGKISTACGEDEVLTDKGNVISEPEEGSADYQLINMLNQAQGLLQEAYNHAVSVNSLARSVQEIKDIQTAALGLTSVIHGVNRLGGLERE